MESAAEPVDVPADLNQRIADTLDKAEASETKVRRISIYSFAGLAAGLLIILSVYLGFMRNQKADLMSVNTIEDPQVAYEETLKVLSYVSYQWNRGTNELRALDEVNKSMRSIKPLQKISSGSKELNLLGNLEKANNIKVQ